MFVWTVLYGWFLGLFRRKPAKADPELLADIIDSVRHLSTVAHGADPVVRAVLNAQIFIILGKLECLK